MTNEYKMNIWQPTETIPKEGTVLVVWGTKAGGPMGYDIVKYRYDDTWKSVNSDDVLPAGGYCIIAWMPLPSFPDPCEICGKPVSNYKPEYCCDGRSCACGGRPAEPCVCSRECWGHCIFQKLK